MTQYGILCLGLALLSVSGFAVGISDSANSGGQGNNTGKADINAGPQNNVNPAASSQGNNIMATAGIGVAIGGIGGAVLGGVVGKQDAKKNETRLKEKRDSLQQSIESAKSQVTNTDMDLKSKKTELETIKQSLKTKQTDPGNPQRALLYINEGNVQALKHQILLSLEDKMHNAPTEEAKTQLKTVYDDLKDSDKVHPLEKLHELAIEHIGTEKYTHEDRSNVLRSIDLIKKAQKAHAPTEK
jgi:hypothetical protein